MSNRLPSYDKSQFKETAQYISNALNNKKKNAKRHYSRVFLYISDKHNYE